MINPKDVEEMKPEDGVFTEEFLDEFTDNYIEDEQEDDALEESQYAE